MIQYFLSLFTLNTKQKQGIISMNFHQKRQVIFLKIDCYVGLLFTFAGLAEIGVICDPRRSCGIIEDNGIAAGFTIAHELGHLYAATFLILFRCHSVSFHFNATPLSYFIQRTKLYY